MSDDIVFEHPLNERCRMLLRLARLFEQFEYYLAEESEWHSRAALAALLDIANCLARADIKSELIKEMDRYTLSLGKMAGAPGVDDDRLRQILAEIKDIGSKLNQTQGQLGQSLRSNEFLGSIQQRSSIPGGSFDFDLPQYHHWLKGSHEERHRQLKRWSADIMIVKNAVTLLLTLIRSSATPRDEIAVKGFFQLSLNQQQAVQLVRVRLRHSDGLYAEISGGKHRFTIRFLDARDLEHPGQTQQDVNFQLTTCVI